MIKINWKFWQDALMLGNNLEGAEKIVIDKTWHADIEFLHLTEGCHRGNKHTAHSSNVYWFTDTNQT